MIELGPACARHRDSLLDFIDRREVGPQTDEALDHLARCRTCEWELEATAMAVMALRRLHREAQAVEPPADAWERVRLRVDRPHGPVWRWRTSLAGLAVGAGLVATLIAPASLWSPRATYLQEPGTEATRFDARRLEAAQEEWRILEDRAVRGVPTSANVSTETTPRAAEAGWTGPDGLGLNTRAPAGTPPAGRSR